MKTKHSHMSRIKNITAPFSSNYKFKIDIIKEKNRKKDYNSINVENKKRMLSGYDEMLKQIYK